MPYLCCQTFGSESQPSVDKPLVAEACGELWRFSVLPYFVNFALCSSVGPDNEL